MLFGYGVRADAERMRWIGIAFLRRGRGAAVRWTAFVASRPARGRARDEKR